MTKSICCLFPASITRPLDEQGVSDKRVVAFVAGAALIESLFALIGVGTQVASSHGLVTNDATLIENSPL